MYKPWLFYKHSLKMLKHFAFQTSQKIWLYLPLNINKISFSFLKTKYKKGNDEKIIIKILINKWYKLIMNKYEKDMVLKWHSVSIVSWTKLWLFKSWACFSEFIKKWIENPKRKSKNTYGVLWKEFYAILKASH